MVQESDLLWTPTPESVEQANVTQFMQWLARERDVHFTAYGELWRWSVESTEDFWQAIWDYFEIASSTPPGCVLEQRVMPGANWFPGASLNYGEHVLRNERPGQTAVMFLTETDPLTGVPWESFAGQVRIAATALRAMGVGRGDRVVAYMPNIPQTMIAMLATTSIGAIWASCSPDFGSPGVLDRLSQLEPKVLFCVDGYRYGGKAFDRSSELRAIVRGLPSLSQVICLPYLQRGDDARLLEGALNWDELLAGPAVAAAEFEFEQVPFSHPLWILFSSGTTGLPKPIVHSHGGILLEMNKLLCFHMDFHPGERAFFYTTTGWMMWNFLASSLMAGVCPVLYDGNPAFPTPDVLWKMAQDCGASFFGASPTYVELMAKAGIVPREKFDLSRLRAIMPAGSPVSPECTAWFYENVKRDLWVATGSGGTDCCTGFVGGIPTLPVYAGEIQAPHLGVAAQAYNEKGESVVNEVGELVITRPMPSMPVCFWNDPDGSRYRESYFTEFPGVWRHGDFFRINQRGGSFVLGRSDATLNRHGVRIGTAEIYRVLSQVAGVESALIVNLDLPGGRFFMPLFVQLAPGAALDDELRERICSRLRLECTPRHVPDQIIAVPAIPVTLSGKKMEVPVRKILMGAPLAKAANPNTMANPAAMDFFVAYARTRQEYPIT
jgi:acetoacetyl-CoA synthetase